jgi:hypothetical protein
VANAYLHGLVFSADTWPAQRILLRCLWIAENFSSLKWRHDHFATDFAIDFTSDRRSATGNCMLMSIATRSSRARKMSRPPLRLNARTSRYAINRSSSNTVQLRPAPSVSSTLQSGCMSLGNNHSASSGSRAATRLANGHALDSW